MMRDDALEAAAAHYRHHHHYVWSDLVGKVGS